MASYQQHNNLAVGLRLCGPSKIENKRIWSYRRIQFFYDVRTITFSIFFRRGPTRIYTRASPFTTSRFETGLILSFRRTSCRGTVAPLVWTRAEPHVTWFVRKWIDDDINKEWTSPHASDARLCVCAVSVRRLLGCDTNLKRHTFVLVRDTVDLSFVQLINAYRRRDAAFTLTGLDESELATLS